MDSTCLLPRALERPKMERILKTGTGLRAGRTSQIGSREARDLMRSTITVHGRKVQIFSSYQKRNDQ